MNVYDFDNTIYAGETVVDFFFFYVKKDLSVLRLFPAVLSSLVKYKMCRISTADLEVLAEKYLYVFLQKTEDLKSVVSEFWDRHQHKIKPFYRQMQKKDDVIISASCDFLLDEICRRLGVRHCICSSVDTKTGTIRRICYREKKPVLFCETFGDAEIENFYSDSLNDLPMMKLAKQAYLVRGNKITKVNVGAVGDEI